jgi:hypothetical protein
METAVPSKGSAWQTMLCCLEYDWDATPGGCSRFMASMNDNSIVHSGLPQAFLHACVTHAFTHQFLTIGHNGTWYIETKEGKVAGHFNDPAVENMVSQGKVVSVSFVFPPSTVVFVTSSLMITQNVVLSPYDDTQCFVEHQDGSTSWITPSSWHEEIRQVARHSTQSSSGTKATTIGLIIVREAAQEVTNEVTEGLFDALVQSGLSNSLTIRSTFSHHYIHSFR